MLTLSINLKNPSSSDKNKIFTARYGDLDIVDIRAKSADEAEDKLVFALASNLRGKLIDFNPDAL